MSDLFLAAFPFFPSVKRGQRHSRGSPLLEREREPHLNSVSLVRILMFSYDSLPSC
jgi:hypothetical protein